MDRLAVFGGGQILDGQAAQGRLDVQALTHGPGAQGRQQTAEGKAGLGRGDDGTVGKLARQVGGEAMLVGRQGQGVVQQVGFGHRSTQQAKEAGGD
ncbi:hypothetical protein D3C72_2352190 [compost metagenome]